MFWLGIRKENKITKLDDKEIYSKDGSLLDKNVEEQKNDVNSSAVMIIKGMVCINCKISIEKALKRVRGVVSVNVDLIQKQAIVTGIGMDEMGLLVKAVEDAGYSVVSFYGWEIRQ